MPCLLVDDRPLVESNLIDAFLGEWAPRPPLMPADPLQRHEVRRWSKYVDDACLPAVQKPDWSRSMQPIAEKWSDEEPKNPPVTCGEHILSRYQEAFSYRKG